MCFADGSKKEGFFENNIFKSEIEENKHKNNSPVLRSQTVTKRNEGLSDYIVQYENSK